MNSHEITPAKPAILLRIKREQKVGFPDGNAIGLKLLGAIIRTFIGAKGVAVGHYECANSLNDGAILICVSETAPALNAIEEVLKLDGLQESCSIHYSRPGDSIWRCYRYCAALPERDIPNWDSMRLDLLPIGEAFLRGRDLSDPPNPPDSPAA